ncbi:hypothetical protein BDV93DRAFT_527904, partial [Ceratobasidium sp. AG-I]
MQVIITNNYLFIPDPRWGVALDEYLDSNQNYSLAKYPVDRVLSAIKTITTNDPPVLISDTTLETVLSVAYYPEHLEALDVEFYAPFYDILTSYLRHNHTLLRRSFGVLLMQVHGMFNMVEFLVAHDKLSAFVDSLARSRIRGVDVLDRLSHEVVRLTGLDREPSMYGRVKLFHTLSTRLHGRHSRSFTDPYLLLECAFKALDEFSQVYSRIPGFGWPLFLLQMWPKLQSRAYKINGPYTQAELLGQLKDLASRWLLVAPPYEHCIVGTLDCAIDYKGEDPSVKDPLLKPHDLNDLKTVTRTFLLRLSNRPARNTTWGLRYLNMMTRYTFHLIRTVNHYDLIPQLLEAAYTRLWIELTSGPSDAYPLDDVANLGTALFAYTCEGCVMSESPSGPNDTTSNIVLSFLRVDFVNMLGRLFLSYTLKANDSGNQMVGTAITEIHRQIYALNDWISGSAKPLHSAFERYYLDWLKVLRYISELQFMYLPSSRLLAPHLERLVTVWTLLGEEVGWSDRSRAVFSCSYARCPGFEAVSFQSLACGECLETTYC